MTSTERAEKICQEFRRLNKQDRACACSFIAAQIDEAVAIAVKEAIEAYPDPSCDEHCRLAKAEALAEAAKLADDEYGCDALAQQIRALADGGGKR